MIRLALFFLVLFLAAVFDIRKRIIPDWMPFLIAGVSLIPSEPVYLTGLFVALPLLIAGITVGGIGGGDIKLTGACGLVLGFERTLAGLLMALMFLLLFHWAGQCIRKCKKINCGVGKEQAYPLVPVELKYVEVIAVTAKSGYDANTGEQMSEEDEKELPSTVTILVRPEQSKLLARLEAEGEIHLSLVFRGDADKASEFIKAQDQVLDEIKAAEEEALQEEDATEEDGQPVINADGQETTEEEETSTDGEE